MESDNPAFDSTPPEENTTVPAYSFSAQPAASRDSGINSEHSFPPSCSTAEGSLDEELGSLPNGDASPHLPSKLPPLNSLALDPNRLSLTKPPLPPVVPDEPTETKKDQNAPEAPSCGCLCFHTRCMTRLAGPISFLVLMCSLIIVQSFIVSGYTNSISTTIEKRYSLKTVAIGVIVSSYDVACIFTIVFVSYFANRMNRARVLGIFAIIMAVGVFLFALPHFISASYKYNPEEVSFLCNKSMSKTKPDLKCTKEQTNETWALYIFVLANIVIGIGASPIYVLGPTYLYDILNPIQYPLYSAFLYVAGALGPALGFAFSNIFLQSYIDTPKSPPLGLISDHSQWLGAWWQGYMMCGGFFVILALPLIAFPKSLPEYLKAMRDFKRQNNTVEDKKAKSSAPPSGGDAFDYSGIKPTKSIFAIGKEFPKTVKRLFGNMVWLFTSLLWMEEQFVVTAFATFISKYLQTVYGQPAHTAGLITGGTLIPSAILGIICGSIVIKKMHLNIRRASTLLLILCSITTVMMVGLIFTRCENFHMAGLKTAYDGVTPLQQNNFTSQCNMGCNCDTSMYRPVCDKRTLTTYFSPCHAGCQKVTLIGSVSVTNYTSCSCIRGGQWIVDGRCPMECPTFIPTIVLIFTLVFITSIGLEPAHIITMTSVSDEDRSFGLGLQNMIIRALAYVPAPIAFGYLFDAACDLWTSTCKNTAGACSEYDLSVLPFLWIGVLLGIKAIGVILAGILVYFARQEAGVDISTTESFEMNKKAIQATLPMDSHTVTIRNISTITPSQTPEPIAS